MKLAKVNKEKEKESQDIKVHIKTSSQDLNNSSNHSNIYLSKIMDQKEIKNKTLVTENVPNLKKSIQNIFANEERKEKALRYLIQKNKGHNSNVSKDYKKVVQTPEIKPYKRIEIQSKSIISPYGKKNYVSFKPIIFETTKSCADIRKPELRKKNQNLDYKYSVATEKYVYDGDEPLYQNDNDIYKENYYNNEFNNLINNNSNYNGNRNKAKKYERIAIYNTYNNTFNNYRMQNNNAKKKNINSQTYDYDKNDSMVNSLNKNNFGQNPYRDYMKNSSMSNVRHQILNYYKKNKILDVSDGDFIKDNINFKNIHTENNNNIYENNKNNYIRRVNIDKINEKKFENLNTKKSPLRDNESLISSKSNANFYVHKNLRYKKLNSKKIMRNDLSANSFMKKDNNFNNINKAQFNDKDEKYNGNTNKIYAKRRNYYDIYGKKDIQTNPISNKEEIDNYNNNDEEKNKYFNSNTIKINIDKNILKDYNNSPLSYRYNKYFINNRNKLSTSNINKKIYEKRDPIPKSPKTSYINIKNKNNNKNVEKISSDGNNDKNINDNYNLKKNKYIFNDDEEIIEYIKKKYQKRNVEEIINKDINNKFNEQQNKNRYHGLMTNEEGKQIKQKNEELSTEIKNLQFQNQQYKKELDDMKNKFNDLSKEINNIKENK